jgi:hypothetical protein
MGRMVSKILYHSNGMSEVAYSTGMATCNCSKHMFEHSIDTVKRKKAYCNCKVLGYNWRSDSSHFISVDH